MKKKSETKNFFMKQNNIKYKSMLPKINFWHVRNIKNENFNTYSVSLLNKQVTCRILPNQSRDEWLK